ncbi:MAG: hypothetical protein S4CHLAM2_18420 [Chlamydiales bacterium]|nr:hypothetical protein [Chlamydiales bacterium]
MKKHILTLTFFLFGLALTKEGLSHEFYGELEALYWKPTHAPIIVGRRLTNFGTGFRPRENLLVTSAADWGVRGRMGYKRDRGFVDLAYLYYGSSNQAHFNATPPSTIRMVSGSNSDDIASLSAELNWRYQNVDARIGYDLIAYSEGQLYLYGNVRWVEVVFHNQDVGVRSDPPVGALDIYTQRTCFDGTGLGLGLGGWYPFFWRLRVGGSLGVMSLIGCLDPEITLFEADTGNELVRVRERHKTYVIPAFEVRFGVDCHFSLCGLRIGAEIGYELDYYQDVIRHNIGIDRDGADDVPQIDYYGAGFGGPYIRFGVNY